MIVAAACKQYSEAYEWAQKAIAADSSDASAYYTSGVADWTMAFPDYMKARKAAGMQPQDPGIIPDAGLRAEFRTQHMSQIQDGVQKLEVALQIKPDYSDAFAYLNLLYRIEAGVADDAGASAELITKADGFVTQALAAQKKRAQSGAAADQADGILAMPAPPPPPPPPPPPGFAGAAMVQVKGSEQLSRLVKQVAPVGPGGVSGTVSFSEVIGKDGRVRNLRVLSGPPALVQAAMEAVRQWEYQPLMVNGAAVEVSTTVEVSFPGQ
jgi:TonB family protein